MLIRPFEKSEARARQLAATVPNAGLFVGLVGAELPDAAFDIVQGLAQLRKVSNAPGLVHVASAADQKFGDYLSISRYSRWITAEVAAGDFGSVAGTQLEQELLLSLAFHITALLKIRVGGGLFAPASSSCSWDTVAIAPPGTVRFHLLDDVPHVAFCATEPRAISTEDLVWIAHHWESAYELRNAMNSRRFGLAYNLIHTWNHVSDLRLAIANLWCALEALFGRNEQQLSAKLSMRIARWLPQISASKVRKLYDIRCQAVHGRWLDETKTINAIKETERILRLSLQKCIETRIKTLPDEA